jgi:pectate disaccharide-lyase
LDGAISTSNANYTGTGYANLTNDPDKLVVWNVNVPAAATYTLRFRYGSGGSSADTEGKLIINGVESDISFTPKPGNSSTWFVLAVEAGLNEGVNDIRIKTVADNSFADIDYIQISPETDVAGAACTYP